MSTVWLVVEGICLVCTFIGALSGNIMLFYIVAKTRSLQTKANVFILNLAAADLLVALINVPVTFVTVIAEDWIFGENVCLITGFITLLTFVASCMALSMISINRYHAVVHWTSYEDTYKRWKCALYVFITWSITIALSLPPFFGWAEFKYDPPQSYCFVEWAVSKSYTIFMIVACLLGPISVMSYCYWNILRFNKESERRVIRGEIMSRDGALNVTDSGFERKQREKHLTRTIITLIAIFVFCWSPFAIIMIVQVFSNVHVPRAIDFGSLILGYLNSFFNVIVYNMTNRKIRNEYKKLYFSIFRRKTENAVII